MATYKGAQTVQAQAGRGWTSGETGEQKDGYAHAVMCHMTGKTGALPAARECEHMRVNSLTAGTGSGGDVLHDAHGDDVYQGPMPFAQT